MKSLQKSLKPLETLQLTEKQIELLKQTPPKTIAKYSRAFFAYYYLDLDIPDHQLGWYNNAGKYRFEFYLAPRDHGKTTVFPRVCVEHDTLFHHWNVLLISKTATQAKKSLDVIAKDLTRNKRIRRDFSYELEDFKKVKNFLYYNLQDRIQRDATVEANGLLGDITGGHFTKIYLDDLLDDENTRTPQSRKNTWKWINGTILPLLEPHGNIIGIGTRKHYEDAYQKMIDNPAWHVVVQKAIITEPESYRLIYDENGVAVDVVDIKGDYEVLWEDKWPIESLLLQKAAMGSILFNREYQNDVTFMKGKILKEEWLNYYAIRPENQSETIKGHPPLSSMEIYQGYDLAIREKEISDFFVCETIGVLRNPFRIYILDWYRRKIPFPEQVKIVKKLFDGPITPIWQGIRWNPISIGIESNAYQVVLAQEVLNEVNLPIHEIISVKNKTTRITAGSVDYENGLVYVPIDHPEYSHFLDEYTSFDEGEHDDILDADDIARRLLIQHKPSIPFHPGLRSSTSLRSNR